MAEIFLYGYYGYQNLGDDIFLYLLLNRLLHDTKDNQFHILVDQPTKLPVEVLQLNSRHENLEIHQLARSKWRRYVQQLKYFTSQKVIYGGGTFAYDSNPKQRRNLLVLFLLSSVSRLLARPSFAISIGVDQLRYTDTKFYVRHIFRGFESIILRDKTSAENFGKLDVNRPFQVLPDLAYAISSDHFKELKKPQQFDIGLNFATNTTEDSCRSIELVKTLQKRGYRLCLITVQSSSQSQEARIHANLKQQFPGLDELVYEGDIHEFLSSMKQCRIIVASKLHLMIAAHLTSIPVLPIVYQEKIRSIAREIVASQYIEDFKFDIGNIVANIKCILATKDYRYKLNTKDLEARVEVMLSDLLSKYLTK